jgi:hypothetical protein
MNIYITRPRGEPNMNHISVTECCVDPLHFEVGYRILQQAADVIQQLIYNPHFQKSVLCSLPQLQCYNWHLCTEAAKQQPVSSIIQPDQLKK